MTPPILIPFTLLLLSGANLFAQGPPGPPPGGPGRFRPPSAEEELQAYLTLDKDRDGKLTKAEVPPRFHTLFTRADQNTDGVLTPDELKTMIAARLAALANRNERPPGGPPPGERPPPPGEGQPPPGGPPPP